MVLSDFVSLLVDSGMSREDATAVGQRMLAEQATASRSAQSTPSQASSAQPSVSAADVEPLPQPAWKVGRVVPEGVPGMPEWMKYYHYEPPHMDPALVQRKYAEEREDRATFGPSKLAWQRYQQMKAAEDAKAKADWQRVMYGPTDGLTPSELRDRRAFEAHNAEMDAKMAEVLARPEFNRGTRVQEFDRPQRDLPDFNGGPGEYADPSPRPKPVVVTVPVLRRPKTVVVPVKRPLYDYSGANNTSDTGGQ
jgi:hypothetical protein